MFPYKKCTHFNFPPHFVLLLLLEIRSGSQRKGLPLQSKCLKAKLPLIERAPYTQEGKCEHTGQRCGVYCKADGDRILSSLAGVQSHTLV